MRLEASSGRIAVDAVVWSCCGAPRTHKGAKMFLEEKLPPMTQSTRSFARRPHVRMAHRIITAHATVLLHSIITLACLSCDATPPTISLLRIYTQIMSEKVHVLYVDYEQHPAPLSRCFHATASRRLSSSVHRSPPTTTTETDSAYCPQCLSFHDVGTAASLGYCSTCKQCPRCMAVASVTIDDHVAFYKCGYCSWTSHGCNVKAAVTLAQDGTIGKEQMLQASKDLIVSLQKRTNETAAETHYQDMVAAWEKAAKDSTTTKPTIKKRGLQPQKAWSLEALEESLATKQERAPLFVGNAQKVSLDDSPHTLDASLVSASPESFLLQPVASSTNIVTSVGDLLPLPMPLRPRKSRRCRAELKEGRPGILVKPKLNPLEGDTSLRSGHGQWWKKDSSAIHVIPKLTVVKQVDKKHFLVKVANPTMSLVRMRLGPSDYSGEGGNSIMKHVLMDSLVVEYKDIVLDREATSTLKPTEMVELQSVEDSFLEMRRAKLPDAVSNWTPRTEDTSGEPFIRQIASHKDAAWFELTVKEGAGVGDNQYVAAPISLQIQVGDGSWESSLVKPQPMEGLDLVIFDVLIAWETNTGASDS